MQNQAPTQTEQTFGQKLVGLSFNPAGNEAVHECKLTFAKAIDQLNDMRGKGNPSMDMLIDLGIQITLLAQMAAVKAITWNE